MILRRGRLVFTAAIVAIGLAGCGTGTPTAAPGGPVPSSQGGAATSSVLSPSATVDDPGCLKPGEKVTRFPGGDGTLPGVVFGQGTVGIIFGHQTNGGLCQWIATAREFAAKGYRTLVFDFAGYQLAEATKSPTTTADIVSAADYLKTLGIAKIALVGASFGGAAVVTASVTGSVPVAAVVSLSGSSQLRTAESPVAAAARLTAPLLCAAAKNDQRGAYADVATQMCPANGPGPRQLLIVDGTDHGVVLYETNTQVKDAVGAFLAKYAPAV